MSITLYFVYNAMLFIEPSKNADAAKRYFRESLSVEDYYSETQEITGQWHGKVAQQLGLSGDVKAKDFENLLTNINPKTGKRLTARNSPNRKPMYDFTFNAPKSVSLVHAITGDTDILKAHQDAVLKTMQAVEADMQVQHGSGKNKHYVTTGNMIFAAFIHTTTRPLKRNIKGKKHYIPDPHLHTHCAAPNVTYFDEQARFRAFELGNVKKQGHYYEALYHSYMAHNLEQAGYELKREGKRWEINVVSRELIERFSTRTMEIELEAQKRGIQSAAAKARLGRLTRNQKKESVASSELHEFWVSQLSDAEYEAIMNAKSDPAQGGSQTEKSPLKILLAKRHINSALEHCLERQSGVMEKKLLAYAIDQAGTSVTPDMLKQALESRDDIYSLTKNTVKYITTAAMEAEESVLIMRAAKSRNQFPALNETYDIQNDILNEGQRAAIAHCLTSPDKIMIVAGDAGVGKTTLLHEVKQGIEEKGKKLLTFAPSSDAARNVLRSKGYEEADTIAMLLNSERLQEQLQDNVMLVDEAGLVGVPTMNQILELAEQHNARVILSGDWKQHSSVERGDALKIIETKAGLTITRVTEIVRQRGKKVYKQIIERVAEAIGVKHKPDERKREMVLAFDALDKHGGILEITHQEERHHQLALDYLKDSQENADDVIVVSPTHKEGKAITQNIRNALQQSGRIEQKSHHFVQLQSKHYTQAQKSMIETYRVGDVIEFHQNAKGFKAGSRYSVSHINDKNVVVTTESGHNHTTSLPLQESCRFDVYEKETIAFSVGDRLRITKNTKSLDNHYLYNGQIYSITGFDENGHIQLSNGETLHKDARHFKHGYVTTSHAAQGKDAKVVLLAQSTQSFAASNDKQFYVSISRGVEQCRIYTDDKTGLQRAISENGDQLTAIEIAEEARRFEEEEALMMEEHYYFEWLRDFYTGIKNIFNYKANEHGETTKKPLDIESHPDGYQYP